MTGPLGPMFVLSHPCLPNLAHAQAWHGWESHFLLLQLLPPGGVVRACV